VEGRVGDGVKVREIFLYAAQADALARALGDGVATRIRVSREGGKDHIALELTGPPRPEPQVQDAFQRITRLRANAIRWTTTPSFDQPLEDTREF
jgi:hypothetical protein